MPLEVHPIAAALGAEVTGVDLTRPLDPATRTELLRAWLDHQVLFFRDQDLSLDQHTSFARQFGELHVHAALQPLAAQGHPEIVELRSTPERPWVSERWHTDVSYEREPPKGAVLRAVEVPAVGGDTLFASTYRAYEALSGPMQRMLSELSAVHDGGQFRTLASSAEYGQENHRAVHPMVRTHPETGRKALFVNALFTRAIVGVMPAESEAVLRFLYGHIASPDFQCRFRWRKGSMAMWDNRCTQHRVVADNLNVFRLMHRVTLSGDVPR